MPNSTTVSLSAEDEAAVRDVPQRIIAAWAAHDADAFAATFTEDGSMILPGLARHGRDEIRGFMAQAFAGPYQGTRVTGTPVAMKVLADDVVLVLTEGGVLAPGQTELAAERAVRASWLLVRREGQWLLTAYQNSPANPA
ncbi:MULTISPECIES: SgcJ/EcaC family oxidoreductase [unclassified Micromonospora]|uniref:SgcJ/EcaC family oxidoreductase n=1 Tax=unclassified Micromonospora TaxID=2617518 RepID=UPI00104DBEE8|nr:MULTISPECIES: SgcJ/EcaC family oxidoreductase [unclassified Micromonospora]TDB81617.1 SgcJ/EcaC family oxidoreductase [Micromonospora sp. KC721]TDC42931.1 SgcJ/EcaC family oxidoreductase [Micromonospora sp. KC213]